jgi:hypothetical protein
MESKATTTKKDYQLIWLFLDTKENSYYLLSLQKYLGNEKIKTFTEVPETFEFIKNSQGAKFVILASGGLGKDLTPLIHDLEQIDSILICCYNLEYHKEWPKSYQKVKKVEDNWQNILTELFKIINFSVEDYERAHMLPSIVLQNDTSMDFEMVKLNSFKIKEAIESYDIYFFLDKLLNLFKRENNHTLKKHFSNYAEKYINKNYEGEQIQLQKKELDDIMEIDFQNGNATQAIDKYDSIHFLSRMINEAFRQSNYMAIFELRYFIYYLKEQISYCFRQNKLVENFLPKNFIYRGTIIPEEDLEELKANKEKKDFLSLLLPGFTTCTTFVETAKSYILSEKEKKGYKSIILEISLEGNNYVEISPTSNPMSATYVMNANSVININKIVYSDKLLLDVICCTLSSQNDYLSTLLRKPIYANRPIPMKNTTNPFFIASDIFMHMHKPELSIQILESFPTNKKTDEDNYKRAYLAAAYLKLSGCHNQASKEGLIAYNYFKANKIMNDDVLNNIYTLAACELVKRNAESALKYAEEAVQQCKVVDIMFKAKCLTCVGAALTGCFEYEKARLKINEAMGLIETTKGTNCYEIGECLRLLGHTYYLESCKNTEKQEDLRKTALTYLEHASEIYKFYLTPSEHPDLENVNILINKCM